MEASIPTIVVSVIIVAALAVAWRGLNWAWLRPNKVERLLRQSGLLGNSYRLLIGDAVHTFRMRRQSRSEPMAFSNDICPRVEPFYHQTIKKYGKNTFLWFGPIPVVVLTEAELVKEVLSRMSDFPKPSFRTSKMITPGLLSYEGEKWAKHRKLVNPAFHMEKLKVLLCLYLSIQKYLSPSFNILDLIVSMPNKPQVRIHDNLQLMLPAFHTSCSEMISKWEKLLSQTSSVELDVWSDLTSMTADVISHAAFSSSYEEGRKAFELIQEQSKFFTTNTLELLVPGLSYLPTRANRRLNNAQRGIRSIIESIIDKRRKKMEGGEAAKEDLLGLLIKYSVEMQQNEDNKQHIGITTEELIDECKLFYFAGQETTSVLITFTMIMLSKHTNWQEHAREEVLKTFGQNTPDFDGLNHLKTVAMILYEVLRLYPPVPLTARTAKNDTRVGSLFLPAGTLISLPIIFTHHDPQQWGEDALEFKPERFSEGISKASRGSVAFFPFGWGPRTCVGQNFALIEAKMALAMILQRFSFELSPSYAHAPSAFITLQPQFGAQVILHQL